MTKIEFKFTNGDSYTMENGSNFEGLKNQMQNSNARFFTIQKENENESITLNLDNIVAIIVNG